jgi:hypothetical protein
VLKSLKFKKPGTLKDISVQTRRRRLLDRDWGDLQRSCEILFKVIEYGQYTTQASVAEARKKTRK